MLKRTALLIVFIFLISFIMNNLCFAQTQKGQVGISTGVQDLQFDFIVPIWAFEKFVIAPNLGVFSVSDNAIDLFIGSAFRAYFSKRKLSTYVGFRFGTFFLLPDGDDTLTDSLLGISFGTEYFIDSHFSIGSEMQINKTSSDEFSGRFGNPGGSNINTATTLYVTFYF